MRNASESQLVFDIFDRFAITRGTIATEGEKRRRSFRSHSKNNTGVPRRGHAARLLSSDTGEKREGPDFRKRESESRDAGCLCVSQHACTHARTYAHASVINYVRRRASHDTQRRRPTIKEPVTFQILAHIKLATLWGGYTCPLPPLLPWYKTSTWSQWKLGRK